MKKQLLLLTLALVPSGQMFAGGYGFYLPSAAQAAQAAAPAASQAASGAIESGATLFSKLSPWQQAALLAMAAGLYGGYRMYRSYQTFKPLLPALNHYWVIKTEIDNIKKSARGYQIAAAFLFAGTPIPLMAMASARPISGSLEKIKDELGLALTELIEWGQELYRQYEEARKDGKEKEFLHGVARLKVNELLAAAELYKSFLDKVLSKVKPPFINEKYVVYQRMLRAQKMLDIVIPILEQAQGKLSVN